MALHQWLLCFSLSVTAGFAQQGLHADSNPNSRSSDLLKDQLRFTSLSHEEIIPSRDSLSQTVHREQGTIISSDGKKVKATWVYRGLKDKPNGDLDLIAVEAGKAKTFAAANRACAKLVPLGEWRLVNVVHVMAFFLDLLPAYPMFDQPQFKGRFFWSTSLNEKQDKQNKDDFFAVNDGGGEKFQVLGFKKFIQWITSSESHAKSAEEKSYFKELLNQVEEGIPVLCIRGREPEGK